MARLMVPLLVAFMMLGAAYGQGGGGGAAPSVPVVPAAGAAKDAAAGAAKDAGAAADAAGAKDFYTVLLSNECDKPILAAVLAANLDGKWQAQGFWKLNSGDTVDAAETRNPIYYVYGHELGDPDCKLGCWSGSTMKELQGDEWPFLEKNIKPEVPRGGTVKHKFTC